MRRFPLLLLLAVLVLPAHAVADTPAFLDDVLSQVCSTLQTAEKCSKCACEPFTQSNPTQNWDAATPIPTCTLMRVHGVSEGGKKIEAIHVICGSAKALYHGGKIADLSAPAGLDRKVSFAVTRSKQHYDMCPGACRHLPVGAVHLFEILLSVDARTGQFAGAPNQQHGEKVERLESHTKELASCYMADDREPMSCFVTTLGYRSRLVYPAKKRQAAMSGWTRTWKLGGPHGMALTVGKLTGKGARSARKEAVGRAPRLSHFRDLEKRPDTVRATEKGEGLRLKIARTPTRPVQ